MERIFTNRAINTITLLLLLTCVLLAPPSSSSAITATERSPDFSGTMACSAFAAELRETVQKLCQPGKGILVSRGDAHCPPAETGAGWIA